VTAHMGADLAAVRADLEAWGYAVLRLKPAYREGWVAETENADGKWRWIVRGPEFASLYPVADAQA